MLAQTRSSQAPARWGPIPPRGDHACALTMAAPAPQLEFAWHREVPGVCERWHLPRFGRDCVCVCVCVCVYQLASPDAQNWPPTARGAVLLCPHSFWTPSPQ